METKYESTKLILPSPNDFANIYFSHIFTKSLYLHRLLPIYLPNHFTKSHWFYRHLLFPIYLPNKFKNTYFSQNICQILSTASFPLELFLHRAFLLRSYFSMEPLFYRVFLLWNFFTYTSPYQPSSMNNIERTGIKDDKKDGLTPPLNQKFSATPKICLKLCSSSKIVDFTSFF